MKLWQTLKCENVLLGVFEVVHLPPVPFVVTDVLLRFAFSSLELPGASPPPTRGWGLARSCISIDLSEQEAREQKLKSQQLLTFKKYVSIDFREEGRGRWREISMMGANHRSADFSAENLQVWGSGRIYFKC